MSSGNPVADRQQFGRIVNGLDMCEEVVSEWRSVNENRVVDAASRLTTGIHILDGAIDKEARTLTVLTEMGESIELAWKTAKEAIAFMVVINSGEAEVMTSTVDVDGRLLIGLTDGYVIITGTFDPLSMNTLGFFDCP